MDQHLDVLIDGGYPLRRLNSTVPAERGCQTSLFVERDGKALFHHLEQHGVICDWREDNLLGTGGGVIRVAPTPLYNTLEEIDAFAELMRAGLNA
jgi:kynureninase